MSDCLRGVFRENFRKQFTSLLDEKVEVDLKMITKLITTKGLNPYSVYNQIVNQLERNESSETASLKKIFTMSMSRKIECYCGFKESEVEEKHCHEVKPEHSVI